MNRELVTSEPRPEVRSNERGGRQPRFLAQSVILEEVGIPGLVRFTIFAVAIAVTAFLAWAAVTEVEEVAVTSGDVVPAGQVQAIQHLEGGIIAEILIRDGVLVEAGETLLRVDPEAAFAELEQMRARRAGLLLKAERLRAFAEQRQPDFLTVEPAYAALADDQRAIYQVQEESRRNRRAVLVSQIQQRQSDLAIFEEKEATTEKNVALLEEELKMRESLFNKGLSPKIVYLDIKRQVNQAYGDYATLQSEWRRGNEALAEARNRLAELESTIKEEAMSEMGAVTNELAQVDETLNKLKDRVRRLDIKVPVRGIVKGLKIHTVSGVIQPGAIVLEIVPMDKELVVETRITTKDIGHVKVGQPVTVKVLTYDYARYGGITGVLKAVSASTFIEEGQDPYYKGVVALDRDYVGADPERNRMLPGMTVQADIGTGRKTLLQYLLKPVYASVNRAFRER